MVLYKKNFVYEECKRVKKWIKLLSIIWTMLITGTSVVYASEGEMEYNYGDEGIVNESLELKVDAVAGKNYTVTVEFTGVSDSYEKINLGFDMVTADQMVPNVDSSNDRSGLIDETVVAGVDTSRTFKVAAVEDSITIKATGSGRITKIKIVPYEAETASQTVIFTIGDSLVQTYTDYYAPQTGWGQTLQAYFDESKVIVKNHALGGRSSGSFMREGRLNEVLVNLKEGDYVLIEFGHNDASKDKVDRYTSVEDYKLYLKEQYIRPIEQRGGIPVLVTLCNRNDYNKATGKFNVSFERYVVAMREVAEETDTLLIDLNARTVEEFTKLNELYGIGISEEIIFNYADAGKYAGAYADGVADNTHLQAYGAKLVGGYVAEGLNGFMHNVLSDAYITSQEEEKKPDTPTDVKALSQIRTVRKIGWTEAKGADFYRIYAAAVEDGKVGEYTVVGHSTTNNFVYGKADYKTDYNFKVIAVNSAGESDESEELLYEAVGKDKKEKTTTAAPVKGEEGPTTTFGGLLGSIVPIVTAVVFLIVMTSVIIVKKKSNKR